MSVSPAGGHLAVLAATIRDAHSAVTAADKIADTVIRVGLRKRIAAGEALAEAQKLVDADKWLPWLREIGLTCRDAHRYEVFPSEYRRYGSHRGGQRKTTTSAELNPPPAAAPAPPARCR
jgi:hypothetical protein